MFVNNIRTFLGFGLLLLICNLFSSFGFATIPNTDLPLDAVDHFVVQPDSVFVMSGFSPNGDGKNDTFTIVGAENLENSKLVIFNMYGAELFSSVSYQNDWDGNPSPEPLNPEEIYLYIFEDGKGHTYSGQFRVNL